MSFAEAVKATEVRSSLHLVVPVISVVLPAFVTLIFTAPSEATAFANVAVNTFALVAFNEVISNASVFGSSSATTVTLEVKVYLLVFPVFFALKLTLIAAGLFSAVATKPRTVTTVPALLFFFPVKFFDFDG